VAVSKDGLQYRFVIPGTRLPVAVMRGDANFGGRPLLARRGHLPKYEARLGPRGHPVHAASRSSRESLEWLFRSSGVVVRNDTTRHVPTRPAGRGVPRRAC